MNKQTTNLKSQQRELEENYAKVEKERDEIYNSFEESIRKIQQQSEFRNQTLEQRLRAAEASVDRTALQVEEIIRAANLDTNEISRVMASLNQMLTAKEDALDNVKFLV